MSKFGEGAGVPMSACSDPNNPSYDPATCHDKSTEMLAWLCEYKWDAMTPWERRFVTEVYGLSPKSRRQHIQIWKIHRKYNPNQP